MNRRWSGAGGRGEGVELAREGRQGGGGGGTSEKASGSVIECYIAEAVYTV